MTQNMYSAGGKYSCWTFLQTHPKLTIDSLSSFFFWIFLLSHCCAMLLDAHKSMGLFSHDGAYPNISTLQDTLNDLWIILGILKYWIILISSWIFGEAMNICLPYIWFRQIQNDAVWVHREILHIQNILWNSPRNSPPLKCLHHLANSRNDKNK